MLLSCAAVLPTWIVSVLVPETNVKLTGVPVVATYAMARSQFLVGAFQQAAAIWDRADATVEVSREHSDYFVRNMVDDPPVPLNIHYWIQVNKYQTQKGVWITLVDPPTSDNQQLHDIKNVKNVALIDHHLEIATQLIIP